MSSINENIVAVTLDELNNIDYLGGLTYQRFQRFKVSNSLPNNELEAIYYLINSHVPSLRTKTITSYNNILRKSNSTDQKLLSTKNNLAFKCNYINVKDKISEISGFLEEMPKEWTIIHLTPEFNPKEDLNVDNDRKFINKIHMAVLNCGKNQLDPFLVAVNAPRDQVNHEKIELLDEMTSIIADNKELLMGGRKLTRFRNQFEKQSYVQKRVALEDRLKHVIKDMQDYWFREWRCLFIGKFVEKELEDGIKREICNFINNSDYKQLFTKKTESILNYLIKGVPYLKLSEQKRAVQYCFPENEDKNLFKAVMKFVRNTSSKLELQNAKKHPVILIIEESLDFLPFEMLDVLLDEPASRVPSLVFLYNLFKEHKADIQDGHKIVSEYEKGTYIVNPDKDLANMEIRMMNFFNYWTADWKGLSGYKPTGEEFYELLNSSVIFSYNGHGSGAHLMSMELVRRTHIQAVVLLFGCGSVRVNRAGPQVEMYGPYHMYLIARCPCVVGMLWEVTDVDADVLSTSFMSNWIPSKAKNHWKNVDREKWKKAQDISFVGSSSNKSCHEPELLRALAKSKKDLMYCFTKASCVARGLPVKILI